MKVLAEVVFLQSAIVRPGGVRGVEVKRARGRIVLSKNGTYIGALF